MSDNDTQDRFFRERRLLLGVSVVLLAHQCLGITVGNSAETLGLRFEIADPSTIWWVVWAIWLWTAVCVGQLFNSIRVRTAYPKGRDDETRARLSDWIAVRRVRKAAMNHLRTVVPRKSSPKFEVVFAGRQRRDAPGGQLHEYACVSVTAQWRCDSANASAKIAVAFESAMSQGGWKISGRSDGFEGGECRFSKTVDVRIVPIRDKRLVRVVAAVWTVLSTSFGTDYLAPLVIAAAPVVVVAYQALAHYSGLFSGVVRWRVPPRSRLCGHLMRSFPGVRPGIL